jgi:hypothetical protein
LALRDQVKALSVMVGRGLRSVKLVWSGSLTLGVIVPVSSMVVPSTRMVLPGAAGGEEMCWLRGLLGPRSLVRRGGGGSHRMRRQVTGVDWVPG